MLDPKSTSLESVATSAHEASLDSNSQKLFELMRAALSLSGREARGLQRVALSPNQLLRLSRAASGDIVKYTGLTAANGARLAAVFEIGRRIEQVHWEAKDSVRTPKGVYRLMAPRVRGLERETLFVITLDGRHRMTGCHRISEGTLTMSLVHPREVFGLAIRESAAAIIVAHNHPSGDSEPSPEDLRVTRRLADAGKLLGIPLLDHVVIGHGEHVSIRERMKL